MMERAEAVQLLEEALARIRTPRGNANGGSEQAGGAYWRLAKVLSDYLDPQLDIQEGAKHASSIRASHGVLVRPNAKLNGTP